LQHELFDNFTGGNSFPAVDLKYQGNNEFSIRVYNHGDLKLTEISMTFFNLGGLASLIKGRCVVIHWKHGTRR
jgi:hypothetical protein